MFELRCDNTYEVVVVKLGKEVTEYTEDDGSRTEGQKVHKGTEEAETATNDLGGHLDVKWWG